MYRQILHNLFQCHSRESVLKDGSENSFGSLRPFTPDYRQELEFPWVFPFTVQFVATTSIIPTERIEQRIFLFRGHRVMLDSDLAKLYKVTTFNLNKAVKRNSARFPSDFMFQLNQEEAESLRFQSGISKPKGRGGRRTLPYAFTQEGISMLSSVLRSNRAIQVNIAIMRTFVRMRDMVVSNKLLASKLAELEGKIENQGKDIQSLFMAIHQLMEPPPEKPKRRIGFTVK